MTHIKKLENKIPDTSGLVKGLDCNAKATEQENTIPSISGLATNAALTVVENKIPNISSFVRKTDYNTKMTETEKKLTDQNHYKINTTPEFHKISADVFDARLKKTDLVTKTDFDDILKSLNQKTKSNKTKCLLLENKF